MEISILTPDMSDNCLGRAYLLARVLQRKWKVEVVGPAFRGTVWGPLAGQEAVTLRVVPGYPLFFRWVSQAKAIRLKLSGDVVYASKPLLTSYGVGLAERLIHKRPLVLDIDDWQVGLQSEAMRELGFVRKLRRLASSALYLSSPGSYWNSLLSERLVGFADEITVSSNFLRDRFGGTVVWHGRDTDACDPKKFDRHQLRDRFGIPEDKKTVIFLGTPRPYKGIADLVEATSLLEDNRVLLILVGLNRDSYSCEVEALVRRRLDDRRVRLYGLQAFERVPEFLAVSDLVVIPQRRNLATVGQVPAKVFDAMAMARPIIATGVSDLPQILGDCGWIVDPEDPQQLARTIQYVFDNLQEAEARGWKAREKCIAQYSWDAMEKTLSGIFRKYEG